jgi:SWI/SNF related-matrix-associated actin-dependent regulator of chromatin subfamily C
MPSTNNVASVQSSHNAFLSNILDSVRPEVLKRAIDASLSATQDLDEAKKASIVGTVASVAAEKAQKEENEIRRTLMDIVDQRVQRLENRIALLDDVEALLEAERVALELERRDMYTARCRQWFGDGS